MVVEPASKGKLLLELSFLPSANDRSRSKRKEKDNGWLTLLKVENDVNFDASGIIESTPFSASLPTSSPDSSQMTVETAEKSRKDREEKINSRNVMSEWTEQTMSSLGNWFFELEKGSRTSPRAPTGSQAGTTTEVEANTESLSSLPIAQKNQISHSSQAAKLEKTRHAGTIQLSITSACLHDTLNTSQNSYYLQIAAEGSKVLSSHTVHDSNQPIFNVSYTLSMPHFRALTTISLMEARSNKKLGEVKVWPYQLVQREADSRIEQGIEVWKVQHIPLLDPTHPQQETGYITGRIQFIENIDGLYWSSDVQTVGQSPSEDLSIERLQAHVARFTALIDLLHELYADYLYLMSWEDPIYTSSLFLLFLFCTLCIQAEYLLSGIVFAWLLTMTRGLYIRKVGIYRQRCISRGPKEVLPAYRPVAVLKLALLGFRSNTSHMRKPVLRLSFIPMLETATGEEKERIEHFIGFLGSCDSASYTEYGSTTGFLSAFRKPDLSKRDQLLHNVLDPWPLNDEIHSEELTGGATMHMQREQALVYPLLQPPMKAVAAGLGSGSMHSISSGSGGGPAPGELDLKLFLPWDLNEGYIKAELAHDPGGFLETDKEHFVLPIKDIASKIYYRQAGQGQAQGHFEMLKWIRCADSYSAASDGVDGIATSSGSGHTEVLLRVGLFPPHAQTCYTPSAGDVQTSIILQQAYQPRSKDTSTFSVLWNMRDYIKYVQSLMAWLLDLLESYKNLFNWTLPNKTYPIYILVLTIWILTICIPGRYLILTIGFYQFFYLFLPIPESDEWVIKWINYVHSIPNDDDLHTIYSQQRREHVDSLIQQRKQHLQATLLGLTLPLHWAGIVQVKSSSHAERIWEDVQLYFQGRRLLWYHSVDDVDAGRSHAGQMLLSRLASLTQLSPVDIREVRCLIYAVVSMVS